MGPDRYGIRRFRFMAQGAEDGLGLEGIMDGASSSCLRGLDVLWKMERECLSFGWELIGGVKYRPLGASRTRCGARENKTADCSPFFLIV